MKHIGLFEGIGGFSLAARWMGWETKAWCEWDTFCQRVLKYHFPEAEQLGDITTTDFTRYAGQIDILTGGFPCQPYSAAGKRLGKEDDRHLWPEMLRAIREVQPRWVVGENVRGLTNWNGGLVFDEVQADLENEGYEVTPYLLPACAVNAPHRRDRIWFVAFNANGGAKTWNGAEPTVFNSNESTDGIGVLENATNAKETRSQSLRIRSEAPHAINGIACSNGSTPHTYEKRLERKAENGYIGGQQRFVQRGPGRQWEDFPTKPPVCGGDDGISRTLDGITFPKWREKSIGAYGNAIVPQIAMQIFKAIQQYEQ